ncbi:MAG TPA: efflux RND transporter periplasmic adaptor subunit [Rhodanobacter sp.]|jgi:multidrug efflux system membrane fusion protein
MNIRMPSSFESVQDTVQDRIRDTYGRTTSRTRLIVGIVAVVAVVAALFYFVPMLFASKPHELPAPPVVVQRVVTADLPVVEHTIGTVVSPATVQVTSRVQGQLLKAFFTEGQTVHAGQVLFQIDPRPFQAALGNAQAVLGTAQAKWARYDRLLAEKAVAPQDADDAKAAYLEAKANVDAARLNLEYTRIASPIDGKTGPILIQPGNQVSATGSTSTTVGTTTAPASMLVVITQIQPIKISFSLPQTDLPRIQKRMASQGMKVTLSPQGGGEPLNAQVDFVGNQVNAQTGTIELRATFGNQDDTLVPGQLADVGVQLALLRNALVVPHDAVNQGLDKPFVYVVSGGLAKMVPVKVLNDDGTRAAVEGDLKVGDNVVTDGQLRVVPGAQVAISKPGRPKQR